MSSGYFRHSLKQGDISVNHWSALMTLQVEAFLLDAPFKV
jgi:hypothetical protein